ncbi:unnamed protein product [Prorocentrum cordatum]|uniref:Uncharacterized protein n=1 Tax=Prorocentrum cordatum TaxID=2364126 RepID=A0ABN9XIB0_9DINO|nr:unnamed protein product [Polarella glacialis]
MPAATSGLAADPQSGAASVEKPGDDYNGNVVLIKADDAFEASLSPTHSQMGARDKLMLKRLKDGVTSGASHYKPALAKKVEESICAHHPKVQQFRPRPLRGGAASLKNEIFGFQHWSINESQLFLGPSSFGVGECRMLCEGALIVAGVLTSELPGNSLREKIQTALAPAGSETFVNLVKDPAKGFLCVMDDPLCVLCAPNKYIVATAPCFDPNDPTMGARGIRWGLMPNTPECINQTKANLEGLCETYAALADNHDFAAFSGVRGRLPRAGRPGGAGPAAGPRQWSRGCGTK